MPRTINLIYLASYNTAITKAMPKKIASNDNVLQAIKRIPNKCWKYKNTKKIMDRKNENQKNRLRIESEFIEIQKATEPEWANALEKIAERGFIFADVGDVKNGEVNDTVYPSARSKGYKGLLRFR